MKHQCVGDGHLVDLGTSITKVQEVSAITLTTRDGGNKGVIIAASTLQKVPIFAKHDVKAMAQYTSRNPLIYDWCLRLVFSRKRHFITILLLVA
jgi:hypothetical protein